MTTLPDTCAPLYQPTFDAIYSRLLAPSCGVAGGGCHAADAKMAGLELDDPDVAYALLLGERGGKQRVIPGDPACSLLLQRLEGVPSTMPPGAPRSASERCSVRQWIQNGAQR